MNTLPAEARWTAHRRVFTNAALVGTLASATKLAAAVKVAVTARYFGAGDALDAYLIAFTLLNFLAEVVAGAFLPGFVPTLIRVRSTRGDSAGRHLVRGALGFMLLATGAMAALLAAGGRAFLPLLASGFPPDKLAMTNFLMLGLLLWLPMSACGITWRAVLNAHEIFGVPAAASLPGPFIAILFLFTGAAQLGIPVLVAATLLGIVVELAILAAAVRRCGYPLTPSWSHPSTELAEVRRQYLPVAAGAVIVSGYSLVDQAVAASLGSGSVSVLTYGSKLGGVLIAITSSAAATVLLPEFTRYVHAGDWPRLRHAIRVNAAVITALVLPVTALLIWTSSDTVRMFFERGAFHADDSGPVAEVQRWLLLQAPFAILGAVAVRIANSLSSNTLIVRAGAAAFTVNVAGDLLLSRIMGVSGIAVADVLGQVALLAGLIALLYAREPRLFHAAERAVPRA